MLTCKMGGFSCKIGPVNTFGRISMDQTIEETINKDTPNRRWNERIQYNKKRVITNPPTKEPTRDIFSELRIFLELNFCL